MDIRQEGDVMVTSGLDESILVFDAITGAYVPSFAIPYLFHSIFSHFDFGTHPLRLLVGSL